VEVISQDGTATSPRDYSRVNEMLWWTSTDTVDHLLVTVATVDNQAADGDRQFQLNLANVSGSGASIGNHATAFVTIIDDDREGITVTATAGANGSITPLSRIVNAGETTTFTVEPDSGYTATVTGCGGTLSGNTYTTSPITEACTVEATFSEGGQSDCQICGVWKDDDFSGNIITFNADGTGKVIQISNDRTSRCETEILSWITSGTMEGTLELNHGHMICDGQDKGPVAKSSVKFKINDYGVVDQLKLSDYFFYWREEKDGNTACLEAEPLQVGSVISKSCYCFEWKKPPVGDEGYYISHKYEKTTGPSEVREVWQTFKDFVFMIT
jgi:hypothetical protein